MRTFLCETAAPSFVSPYTAFCYMPATTLDVQTLKAQSDVNVARKECHN